MIAGRIKIDPLNFCDSTEVSTQFPTTTAVVQCSYWFNAKYNVCARDPVPTEANVIKVSSGHTFYCLPKSVRNANLEMLLKGKTNEEERIICKTGSIFHFQSWKKNYYPSTMIRSVHIRGWNAVVLITETGFIPLMTIAEKHLNYKSAIATAQHSSSDSQTTSSIVQTEENEFEKKIFFF